LAHQPPAILGKVAEVIIPRRLKEQGEDLHVILDEQFGFRRTLSTELQVLRMTEYITEEFNRKEATGAVLLDVSKAFDRVWRRRLLIKMLDAGFSVGLVKLIISILPARRFLVKIDSVHSSYREMEAEVPQGAVPSSFLYNIYVSNPPRTQRTSLALYADDTAIIARSRSGRLLTRYLQEETPSVSRGILFPGQRMPMPNYGNCNYNFSKGKIPGLPLPNLSFWFTAIRG